MIIITVVPLSFPDYGIYIVEKVTLLYEGLQEVE